MVGMTEGERQFAREMAEKYKKSVTPRPLSDKEKWRITVTDNPRMSDNAKDFLNQAKGLGAGLNIIGWIIIGLLILFGLFRG
jgi:hypothetical protein